MYILKESQIEDLKQKYQDTGVITFPLFLAENPENYRKFLLDDIPKEDWEFVTSTGLGQITIPWSKNNLHNINYEWNRVEKLRSNPQQYKYFRSNISIYQYINISI
jgi:hypothetical protein